MVLDCRPGLIARKRFQLRFFCALTDVDRIRRICDDIRQENKRSGKGNNKVSRKKYKKSLAASICAWLGTIMLTALVVFCIPLTLPRLFGYHIYSVVSGSMEPSIPVGSMVYIKNEAPEDMKKDDVIAFYGARDSNAIITHRVVENRIVMGEFITKGDANQTEDMNPVPYDNFIGKVTCSIPKVGGAAQIFTSVTGKIAAVVIIVVALILETIASTIEKRRYRQWKQKNVSEAEKTS